MRDRPCCWRRGDAVDLCIPCPPERARGTPGARCTPLPARDAVDGKTNAPRTSGATGITRRSARGVLPACFVLFPADGSTPGAEDAVRRPVGVANSPLRDAPFGIEKPHDLGRRASVVVSLGSRRSRSSGLERTLCTRRTFASGLAPCDLRSGLTLPRHRIPPREHGRRERPLSVGRDEMDNSPIRYIVNQGRKILYRIVPAKTRTTRGGCIARTTLANVGLSSRLSFPGRGALRRP
jgi:hypothetical protein